MLAIEAGTPARDPEDVGEATVLSLAVILVGNAEANSQSDGGGMIEIQCSVITADGVIEENRGGAGEEDYARWGLQNIQRISKILGMTFEELEERAMTFFKDIERRREKVEGSQSKPSTRKRSKG